MSELLITSYYNIVKRTMIDMVPKAIMYTLVQYVFFFFFLGLVDIVLTFQIHQG